MAEERSGLDRLLRFLLDERGERGRPLPSAREEKRALLRALMNTRPPEPLAPEMLALQDAELLARRAERGEVPLEAIPPSPLYPRLRLWRGDITRLAVDAIVNAANAQMLGCFIPLHACIDNAIHSAAGAQLREECARQMRLQGHDEPTGSARITPGFNLPARWVIHTVGPIVTGAAPTPRDCRELAACYENCLALAKDAGLASLAFCSISTGVFRFPRPRAAEIAVETVRAWLGRNPGAPLETVVFDVFSEEDAHLYGRLLGYA